MIETVIFYFLATLVVIPAILAVNVRNVFHAALWIIASLLGVAGIYALLAADFLFAVQLMVYAGGIMVILLFVVLLSGKPSDWQGSQVNEKAWAAALFSGCFIAILISALHGWVVVSKKTDPELTTGKLGTLLLGEMILPFEVIALVLVTALIGAIYFSTKRSS